MVKAIGTSRDWTTSIALHLACISNPCDTNCFEGQGSVHAAYWQGDWDSEWGQRNHICSSLIIK